MIRRPLIPLPLRLPPLWAALLGLLAFQPAAAQEQPADSVDAGHALHVLWRRDVGRSLTLAPAVLRGHLVLAGSEGKLVCLDLTSGRKLWSKGLKQAIEIAPETSVLADSTAQVLVALSGGEPRLRALSLDKGKTLWMQKLRFPVVQLEARQGRCFLLDARGTLAALACADGREIWKTHFGGWRAPGFLLEGDRIIVLAREDSLAAFSAESGKRLWGSRPGGRFAAPPRRVDGSLLLLGSNGEVKACDPDSGEVLLRGRRTPMQIFPPAAVDSLCVTVSSGGVVEAGTPGSEAPDGWRYEADRAPAAEPVVLGPLVLVSCADGTLVALRSDRGTRVWTLHVHGGLRLPPFSAGGLLLLCTAQAEVIAYSYSP